MGLGVSAFESQTCGHLAGGGCFSPIYLSEGGCSSQTCGPVLGMWAERIYFYFIQREKESSAAVLLRNRSQQIPIPYIPSRNSNSYRRNEAPQEPAHPHVQLSVSLP